MTIANLRGPIELSLEAKEAAGIARNKFRKAQMRRDFIRIALLFQKMQRSPVRVRIHRANEPLFAARLMEYDIDKWHFR